MSGNLKEYEEAKVFKCFKLLPDYGITIRGKMSLTQPHFQTLRAGPCLCQCLLKHFNLTKKKIRRKKRPSESSKVTLPVTGGEKTSARVSGTR